MSRVAATPSEEKTAPKAPRKRATPKKAAAPKKTTTRKAPAKKTTTPRKTTTRKAKPKKAVTTDDVPENTLDNAEEVSSEKRSTRKAPTQFAEVKAEQKSRRTQYIVIAFLIMAGVGSSAAVGFSDEQAGKIDVAQTIKERNERMANLVDVNGPTVVVPTPSQTPDGGLIGLRPTEQSPTPAPVATTTDAATTTASTTSATSTATSTDSGGAAAVTVAEPNVAEPPATAAATDTATTTVEAGGVTPETTESNS